MPADFNKIAWFYDFLSQLIFGKAIKISQINLLHFVSAGTSILIIGGGTGWVLEEIGKRHASGLQITYVDSSSKMIAMAQKRNIYNNRVTFITAPIESLALTGNYDVVLTPFLFDMFTQRVCYAVIEKLKNRMNTRCIWLYCDFNINIESPVWQKVLLRIMYCFFRVSCGISAKELPLLGEYFSEFHVLEEKTFCRNFIVSKAFKNEK